MAQVYGCIECGMLFAGWEYCLAHIEHCRPQHYLEVDKKTLKEMCMIGHRRCLVPAYQPALINGVDGDGTSEEYLDDGDDMDTGISKSSSDGSNGETTLTQDFLNPVEQHSHFLASRIARAEKERLYRDRHSDASTYDGQEQMVMQLFDGEHSSYAQLHGSISSRQSADSTTSNQTPVQGSAKQESNTLSSKGPTQPPKKIDVKKELRRIEKNIYQLIEEASPIAHDEVKMLLLEVLPKVYEVQFGTKLDFKGLGFPDIKSLLRAIPSITVEVKKPYYNIEHEYIRLTDPSRTSLLSWGDDESEDEERQTQEDGLIDDRYNPYSKQSSLAASNSEGSMDGPNTSNFNDQKTPQHANRIGKQFSFGARERTQSSSDESHHQPITEQTAYSTTTPSRLSSSGWGASGTRDEESLSGSTGISSCGSSKSVILALAEMLPATNAYSAILRVLSKNPDGITIGRLLLQAPEFKNFLSHCTDRRCEAQIKLAHSVLEQVQGIWHKQTADGTVLYFQAPQQTASKPFSIVTRMSQDESVGELITSSGSLAEKAAALFAASEFASPKTSPRHTTGRPGRLDTISTPISQVTPNGSPMARSRNPSPRQAPGTPPRGRPPSPASTKAQSPSRSTSLWINTPSTPKTAHSPSTPSSPSSRQQSIAESAARILAEAQSMTSPANIHKKSSNVEDLPEDAARMLIHARNESANNTPRSHSDEDYVGETRMYFFTEEMSPNPHGETSLASEDRAASPMTVDSYAGSTHSIPNPPSKPSIPHLPSQPSKGRSFLRSQPSSKPVKKTKTSKQKREEAIEKIALDLFPTTRMHYQLLLALAENPNGLTIGDINKLIPTFAPFVEKHGKENGIDNLEASAVLEACVSVMQKKDGDSFLYFINAPKSMPSRSRSARRNREEDTSVTSDMSDSSSTAYGTTSIHGPSALSLAFIGSDTAAVLFFLRRIKEDFSGRIWPTSWEQIHKFFLQLESECKGADDADGQMFYAWINLDGETGELRNSKRKEALKKILHQLQRMNCLTWKNSDIFWDERAATAVVIKHPIKSSKKQQDKATDGQGDVPISFIETIEQLDKARKADPFCKFSKHSREQKMVSVLCEGTQEQLHLVLVGTQDVTYIFDCIKLDPHAVCDVLADMFADKRIVKTIHEAHSTVSALAAAGGFSGPYKAVFDTQLAMEVLTGAPSMTANQMFRQLGIKPISSSHPMAKAKSENSRFFGQRPISTDALSFEADTLDLHTLSAKSLLTIFHSGTTSQPKLWNTIEAASELRSTRAMKKPGCRHICFDIANGHALASEELLQSHRPADAYPNGQVFVANDVQSLFQILPEGIVKTAPDDHFKERLSRISLDNGRPAMAWLGTERVELGRAVTTDDIKSVTKRLDGDLDRCDLAGVKGHLHRVTCVRNRRRDIIGLTMHVERHVTGASNMIMDLLFFDPTKSILVLGENESGKTAVLRDAARILSEKMSVSIVDTHNEIAGCCDTAHSSVGAATRMMVHRREEQGHEIVRCVQSQRPHAIVVDELDSKADIGAAYYCKRRSIRMMASAVGTMEDLLNDPSRSLLLGGVKDRGGAGKLRASEPIFDVIVELRRGVYNEWRIIDTADAVDAMLQGKPFQAQVRTRDPETGKLFLAYEKMY